MIKLTNKQTLIYEWIKKYIMIYGGMSPTTREIGNAFEISVKGARDHMLALEKKNYIGIRKRVSRGIFLKEIVHYCPYCGNKLEVEKHED